MIFIPEYGFTLRYTLSAASTHERRLKKKRQVYSLYTTSHYFTRHYAVKMSAVELSYGPLRRGLESFNIDGTQSYNEGVMGIAVIR